MSSEVSERAVEAVARALATARSKRAASLGVPGLFIWDQLTEDVREEVREDARASISAYEQAALSSPPSPIDDGVTQDLPATLDNGLDMSGAVGRVEATGPEAKELLRLVMRHTTVADPPRYDAPALARDAYAVGRIAAIGDVRRRTIEECARVAEAKYRDHGASLGTARARNYEHASRAISQAIRSLSAKEKSR